MGFDNPKWDWGKGFCPDHPGQDLPCQSCIQAGDAHSNDYKIRSESVCLGREVVQKVLDEGDVFVAKPSFDLKDAIRSKIDSAIKALEKAGYGPELIDELKLEAEMPRINKYRKPCLRQIQTFPIDFDLLVELGDSVPIEKIKEYVDRFGQSFLEEYWRRGGTQNQIT